MPITYSTLCNREEFGILIIILIMLIFLILSYQILRKINLESDNKAKLILVGSITIILLQAFIHIGVNIRFLPTTGMINGLSIIAPKFKLLLTIFLDFNSLS